MIHKSRHLSVVVAFVAALGIANFACGARGANPSAEQALRLTPIQDDVDYDRPSPEEAAKCKIFARRIDGHVGWVVESPEGLILRKFVDTNGDNVVDQWSYYKDGVEVYRDIDSNFTGKVDQYRWFNSGGTRWGVDKSQTGRIEYWKVISAEEVTAEVVAALAKRDAQRFARLLLAPEDVQSLGLSKSQTDALAAKLAKAEDNFRALAARQRTVTADSKCVQFGGAKPGIVPADADGPSRDLQVYENVFAIVQTAGRHSQVQIGTLIRLGDAWRLIDAPAVPAEGRAETPPAGFFFQLTSASRPSQAASGPGEQSPKLLAELEKLDQFDPRRAELLEQMAASAKTADERSLWYRQLADTISASVQSGKSPDGDKRLETLFKQLDKNEADRTLAAYVRQNPVGMAENAAKIHRRLPLRPGHRGSHAAIGHRPGVRRSG
jgi:hypothetical protein